MGYEEFYTIVVAAGQCNTFEEYQRSYDLCYHTPLDELELHIHLRSAVALKTQDEHK